MRATDFLTESQTTEIQTLTEGPLGSLIKAAGRGIGKAVGGVAKGAGAVAGGVAGIGSAFKKGYQSGKTTVAGDDATAQPQQTTTPSQTTTPTQGTTDKDTETVPTADPKTTATPKPTVQPAADPNATPKPTATTQPATTDAKPMAGSGSETEPAADSAKDTEYGKALKFVKGLPVAQQKEMIALLQKDPKVVAAMNRPAATKDTAAPEPGLTPDKFGKMAQDLAGGAQKTADAKPQQQTNQPAPQPNSAETPAPTAGNTAQQDLKAKLQAKQGLATTSGTGFKQGMVKGNMRLGAGRGGVTMNHVPQGMMIGEGFSLFRKQQ